MIKMEHTEVSQMKAAFRGMRNPLDSWAQSDSKFALIPWDFAEEEAEQFLQEKQDELEAMSEEKRAKFEFYEDIDIPHEAILRKDEEAIDVAFLGPKDLELAKRLVKAGSDHGKFLRQIAVSVDITAPLFWWKEFDTYKVGTVANSCSTMHTLGRRILTLNDFSFEGIAPESSDPADWPTDVITCIVACEQTRQKFVETKDKAYWKRLIQMLPNAFNQKRTVTLNYQVLRNQYFSRSNHKLTEWHDYCAWIESLPYAKELILCQ